MNSNYSWQQHQTNERLQARLSEADSHRSLKRNNKEGEHPFYTLGRILLLPLTGLAAMARRLASHDRSDKSNSIQRV